MLIVLQLIFVGILIDAYRTLWIKRGKRSHRGLARFVALSFLVSLGMSDLLMDRVHDLRFRESWQCGGWILAACGLATLLLRNKQRAELDYYLSFKVFWVGLCVSLVATAYCTPQGSHHYNIIHFGFVVLAAALSVGCTTLLKSLSILRK